MWKPDQSLDDYVVRPEPEAPVEPPRSVSLAKTGEVEVLKPLLRSDVRVKRNRSAFRAFRRPVPLQPLWFRRFLAVGSGALVMIALALVSAILVGINDRSSGVDVATNVEVDDQMTEAPLPFTFDVSFPSASALATGELGVIRSNTRRRTARPVTNLVAARPIRRLRPLPQPEEPKFIPTTYVIYAENGVINTRIEPWFQGGDKKPPTYNN